MIVFDLKTYLRTKQEAVNTALKALWDDPGHSSPLLVRAMRYSLEAGGKRFRPILCIAASEAVGGSEAKVMPAACALELIHTYSLIHDDLPAMDDDDLRRGQATCHKAFDEAIAILAGDGLLTAAFEVLASAGLRQQGDGLDWLHTIHLIAEAAGYTGMVQGQLLDVTSEKMENTVQDIEALQWLKTGALIQASVRAGAILGGGTTQQIDALSAYGRHVGIAFQIADDILNIEGEPELLGKPVGTDQAHRKATLPSLIGVEEARGRAREHVERALAELTVFAEKGKALAAVARYVIVRNR